jgi:xRRM domain-containing protein
MSRSPKDRPSALINSQCHIRVSHPTQSQAIVSYLAQTTLVQSDGNDATIRSQSIYTEDETRPLVAELVQGRAESIYWEKVPEKIRRVAITKSNRHNRSVVADNNGNLGGLSAVEDAPDRSPGTSGTSASKKGSEEPGTEEREKKRRRRA